MPEISPVQIKETLTRPQTTEAAAEVAVQLRQAFEPQALVQGVLRVEATTVLWAVEVQEGPQPTLVTRTFTEDGSAWAAWTGPHPDPRPDLLATDSLRRLLQPLPHENLYVRVEDLPNFSATAYPFEMGEQRGSEGWVVLEHFIAEPECFPQPVVPCGQVSEHLWRSRIFPGTLRGYWVYVPAQYQPGGPPACLMVFQDGGMYLEPPANVPVIFDNLIARGEMPLTVGLFVNPGTFPEQEGRFQNRSVVGKE